MRQIFVLGHCSAGISRARMVLVLVWTLALAVLHVARGDILVFDQFESCVDGGATITCAASTWTSSLATRTQVLEIEVGTSPTILSDMLAIRQGESLTMTLDTTGFEDIEVNYASAHRNLDSVDGEHCSLAFNAGTGFQTARNYLPVSCNGNTECPSTSTFNDALGVNAADNSNLQIRFTLNADSAFEYCLFDNLLITGNVIITSAPTTLAPTTLSPSHAPTTPDPTPEPTTLAPSHAPSEATDAPSTSPTTLAPSTSPTTSSPTTPTTLSPSHAPSIDDTGRPSLSPTVEPPPQEEPQNLLVPALAAVACGSLAFGAILMIHRRATQGPTGRTRVDESTGTRALDGGTEGYEIVPEAHIAPEPLGLESIEGGRQKVPNAEVVSAILAPSGSKKARAQAGRAAEFGDYIPKRKRKMFKEVEEELAVPPIANPMYGNEGDGKGKKTETEEKTGEQMLDTEDEEDTEKVEEKQEENPEEDAEKEKEEESVKAKEEQETEDVEKEEEAKEEEKGKVEEAQEDAGKEQEKEQDGSKEKAGDDDDDDKESFF